MNDDVLDQLIAESLQSRAAHAPGRGAGFNDVRRRVRQRRQRHIIVAVVPTMVGTAWVGMRVASGGEDTRPSTGAGVDTSTASSPETTQATPATVPPPTTPELVGSEQSTIDSTPVGSNPTLTSGDVGTFVCVDATGGSVPEDTAKCQELLGGGASFTSGVLASHGFVMPLDPAYQTDAEYAASVLDFPVEPLQTSFLTGIDLTGTPARVVVVIAN
jgi:hypothetical protein